MSRGEKTVVVNMHDGDCDRRVDRRSRFGNPYTLPDDPNQRALGQPRDHDPRRHCLRRYARWLAQPRQRWIRESIPALQGLRIGCWCAPKLCHAHLLAVMADGLTDDPLEACEMAIRLHAGDGEGNG